MKKLIQLIKLEHTGCNGNIELNEKLDKLFNEQKKKNNWW